jgi:hypothetical protein
MSRLLSISTSSHRRVHSRSRVLVSLLALLLLAVLASNPAAAAPDGADAPAPPHALKGDAADLEADSRPDTPAPVRAGSAKPGPA